VVGWEWSPIGHNLGWLFASPLILLRDTWEKFNRSWKKWSIKLLKSGSKFLEVSYSFLKHERKQVSYYSKKNWSVIHCTNSCWETSMIQSFDGFSLPIKISYKLLQYIRFFLMWSQLGQKIVEFNLQPQQNTITLTPNRAIYNFPRKLVLSTPPPHPLPTLLMCSSVTKCAACLLGNCFLVLWCSLHQYSCWEGPGRATAFLASFYSYFFSRLLNFKLWSGEKITLENYIGLYSNQTNTLGNLIWLLSAVVSWTVEGSELL
jgi:hypothetical protein